ncbi:ABC transporter permease, partial [Streptomyces anulatus]
MSQAETAPQAGTVHTRGPVREHDPARPRNPLWTLGLLRSEITTLLRRHRTFALLGVLAAVPVLIGIAVRIETGGGGGGSGGPDGGAGPATLYHTSGLGLQIVDHTVSLP